MILRQTGIRLSIKTRLWLAWQAFWLKPIDLPITRYEIANTLYGNDVCDNNRRESKCYNMATNCMSRIWIKFEISKDADHYHICPSCTDKLVHNQQPEKFPWEKN